MLLKENVSTLYLVRHGQAEMNAAKLLSGQLEPNPLTKKGIKQAEKLAEELCTVQFDMIFSSDLERAKQTAEIIATYHKRKKQIKVTLASDLRERHWGRLQGKPIYNVQEELKEMQMVFSGLSLEKKRVFKFVEDMENDAEIMTRFLFFLKKIAKKNVGKNLLIVCHSNLMRTFLVQIGYVQYGELPSGSISNAGYIKLVSDGDTFNIIKTSNVNKQKINASNNHINN